VQQASPLRLCRPIFLTRRLPDLARSVGIDRGNAKTDDQVRPGGQGVGREQAGRDDRDVGQRINSGRP
jgi:hypothetical protein